MKSATVIIALCVGMVGYILGFQVGRMVGWSEHENIRQEAIDAGAAHWEIDPQTGVREFVWNGGTPR